MYLSCDLGAGPEKVMVLTCDGRSLVGSLLACDQLANMVLSQTVERIIRPRDDPEASREISHGLYLIRGDTVAVVGLIDEALDATIHWSEVRGEVIGGVTHS